MRNQAMIVSGFSLGLLLLPLQAGATALSVNPLDESRLIVTQSNLDTFVGTFVQNAQWMAFRQAIGQRLLFPAGLSESDVPIGPHWVRVWD